VLDGFGVPLQYHEYEAGHERNMAMAGDFKLWFDTQLDQSDASQT
jgi:hypothetical protein